VISTAVRFPLYIFNPRNSASLRLRYSSFCHYRLSRRRIPGLAPRPEADFAYLTLTCRQDILMTQLSLKSLWRTAHRLPSLAVAHDETLAGAEVLQSLSFWPGPVGCIDRAGTAAFHERNGAPFLAEFCRRHVFGFKLAACLRLAAEHRVFYADSDVLWLHDIGALMSRCGQKPLYAAVDCGPSYDFELAGRLGEARRNRLLTPPHINAGVALFNRALPELNTYDADLASLLANGPISQFSEQTLVALLVQDIGGTFGEEDVRVTEDRLTAPSPSFRHHPWIARHYISPVRAQYWIDAMAAA
jgi:hypothetical protein